MAFPVPDLVNAAWSVAHMRQPQFAAYVLKRPIPIVVVPKSEDPTFTMSADGKCIKVGEQFAGAADTHEVAAGICHEVLHDMLSHPKMLARFRKLGKIGDLPFDEATFQHSLDYLINDVLHHCGVPISEGWLHDPGRIDWMDDEISAYRKEYEANPPPPPPPPGRPPPPQAGNRPGQGMHDVQDEPAGVDAPGDEAQKQMVVRQAFKDIDPKKLRGSNAAGFERLLERLAPTNVDWRSVLRPKLRTVMGKDHPTWTNVSRAAFSAGQLLPGRYNKRVGKVTIIADTSGSIGQSEMERFLTALAEIFKSVMPKELLFIEIDAKVHRVRNLTSPKELTAAVNERKLRGGGGTDMRKAFRYLADNKLAPDLVAVLTDMYTPFPEDTFPAKEVIWVSTTAGKSAPDAAGRTVYMLENQK